MQIYKKKMKNPTHFTTDWICKNISDRCRSFVAKAGLEPARTFRPSGFSYHICFYTGKLFTPQLEMTYCLCISINIDFTSLCGLDYFFTILEILQDYIN